MAGERMQDPVYAALAFGPGTIKDVSPRVFLRPSDIVKKKSWGGETYHGLADSPAEVIKGIPVTKADLPEKLYHVTTSPDVIRKSRMLRSMHGEEARGLGKGSSRAHQGVSFTMNRQVAENIQRNLKRNIRLAQESDDFAEAVYRYAREDELAAGLPEGALNEAVEASLSDYRVRIAKLGEEPRYAADSSINIYRWRVEDLGGPENPIIFGSADDFAKLDASRVDILEVPTGNIPEDVLIRKHPLGSKHLDEVMVHSDVPVDMPAVAPVGKGVAGGKDVVGGAGRGGAVGNLSRTEFDDWFRGSKVTQEHGFRAEYWRNKGYGRDVPPPGKTGTPKVMTHVTRSEFETFDTMGSRQLGSHFAPDVVTSGMMKGQEEGVRKVKAYLNIKNPLRIPDIEDFSASRVLRQAQKQGVFTAQEADEIAGYLVANTILINELEDKGFDGLVYLNRREVAMHGGGSPYDWVRKYRPDLSGARPEPHIQSPLAKFMDEVSDEWWYEHIPSDDSYVAFRPEQIKVVK